MRSAALRECELRASQMCAPLRCASSNYALRKCALRFAARVRTTLRFVSANSASLHKCELRFASCSLILFTGNSKPHTKRAARSSLSRSEAKFELTKRSEVRTRAAQRSAQFLLLNMFSPSSCLFLFCYFCLRKSIVFFVF